MMRQTGQAPNSAPLTAASSACAAGTWYSCVETMSTAARPTTAATMTRVMNKSAKRTTMGMRTMPAEASSELASGA